jgi:hypothetical protein
VDTDYSFGRGGEGSKGRTLRRWTDRFGVDRVRKKLFLTQGLRSIFLEAAAVLGTKDKEELCKLSHVNSFDSFDHTRFRVGPT